MSSPSHGQLVIVAGSSQCGKSTKTLDLIKGFETVFIWDIEAQFYKQRGFKKVSTLAELKAIVKTGKKGKWCYVSGGNIKAEFELFCMCVFHYGSYFGECAIVAEELADVTSTAKAGEQWGMLCRRGLKRHINIFAISQRWAEADKTALGNATDFYLFRMSSLDDIKYMSRKTRVSVTDLESLNAYEYAHYSVIDKKTTIQRNPKRMNIKKT